jgi:hypothetical protein
LEVKVRLLAIFGALFMTACAALPALAQAVDPDPLSYIGVIWAAIQSGQYLAAGAGVTLILVLLIKKYLLPKLGLGSGILPVVSIVLGIVSGVGMAIMGGAPLGAAIAAAFSGPVASSLWDALIKYFFKK